jgi:hypothetical protein
MLVAELFVVKLEIFFRGINSIGGGVKTCYFVEILLKAVALPIRLRTDSKIFNFIGDLKNNKKLSDSYS